jgi:undecaprenyl pyrophosphate synthase
MRAAEARALAETNAERIAREKVEESAKRKVQRAAAEEKKRKEYYAKTLEDIQWRIDARIKDGITKIEDYRLSTENWTDRPLAGEQKFFKNFEFAAELKKIITKLRRDGYKVTVKEGWVEHDDSAAYLNSGGECGSETPYNMYHTWLEISWEGT